MHHKILKSLIPVFFVTVILTITSNTVLGQSDEKTFTNTKLGLSMKYPSDWTFVPPSVEEPTSTEEVSYEFCPNSYLEQSTVHSCTGAPVQLLLIVYKLENGTTLKDFYDQQIAIMDKVKDIVGSPKNIETTKSNISGISAIQTTSTLSGNGGSLGKLLQGIGSENPTSKRMILYLVNGSTGYRIYANTDDEQDFDTYLPTLQKMINSIQIQGAKENPDNIAYVPNVKNAPAVDVVLLSQKLKKGSGDYNDIIGQVKNIGTDTVKFVKIGLTVYDKNGDVVGTDSTYSTASTLEPNQKSSFDIISTKDNFDGMASYELSLQWQDSDGTDQYVDNAQIYKVNEPVQ
jgi:hypothetical protein